jgi:glutamyl-tRNA reductase
MDGILNIPILWVDNLFMMGKYYAGGWKAARNANKTVTRATKEAMKDAKAAAAAGDMSKLEKLNEIVAKAEKTAYKGLTAEERALVEEVHPRMLGKVGGATKKALTPFVREGNEEMS